MNYTASSPFATQKGAKKQKHPPAPFTTSYEAFLVSHYWWTCRKMVFERDGHQCTVCGRGRDLEAHHLTYAHHGDEKNHLEDLVTLCKCCHAATHGKEPRRSKGEFERGGEIGFQCVNMTLEAAQNRFIEGGGKHA